MPADLVAKFAPLFEWQATRFFSRYVDELDRLAGDHLLADGMMKPLAEALILRDLAVTFDFSRCRLVPKNDQFPDAEATENSEKIQIEITEVMTPGRKRQKEYRKIIETGLRPIKHYPHRQIDDASKNWQSWLLKAIEKKLKYDSKIKFDIAVYNNIDGLFETRDLEGLSEAVGNLLRSKGFNQHRIWHCRSTSVDMIWPTLIRRKIPNWKKRF